jgi:hypothetical protein
MTARLNEATVVLWRDERTVQLELGPRRLVLDNVRDIDLAPVLPARYSRTRRAKAASGTRAKAGNDTQAQAIAEALADTGLLVSAPPPDAPDAPDAADVPGHLLAEAAALRARFGGAGDSILRARASATVSIHGASRIAALIAANLAASGVGTVRLAQGGDVAAAHACPGGLLPADEGKRFGTAGQDAVRRAAPGPPAAPRYPDQHSAGLVVLTEPGPVEQSFASSLHLESLAHIVASVDGAHAVVGPLVVPGATSCLRCADLARCDRDPGWPLLAMQLGQRPSQRTASDTSLCVATAGLATGQALAYLDGFAPETVNGTFEWMLPNWRLRRRTWTPHPRCNCGAAA